eukprot:9107410-Pyramimonas_sp.AAC.1
MSSGSVETTPSSQRIGGGRGRVEGGGGWGRFRFPTAFRIAQISTHLDSKSLPPKRYEEKDN